MPVVPRSFLFGDESIATASAGQSNYRHTFGGPPDREGTAREDCDGILIHLLHRLDLSDPAVPIAIPSVRWLPFYYCFDFRANDLGYRLLSEDRLVTFFSADDPNVTSEESWPDDDYPAEFPRSPIALEQYPYDPAKIDDAYTWSGIFGIGRLSADDQAEAQRRLCDRMEGLGLYAPETEEEFAEAFTSPFAQGKPDSECLNPACPNHAKKRQLTTIAILPAEPVAGVRTFGRWGGGVQLIFLLCGLCHTIRVTNQCG